MIGKLFALMGLGEFAKATGMVKQGYSVANKFAQIIRWIGVRFFTYYTITFMWNFFVHDQQYLFFDFINIQPNLYKPSYNLFSLFTDFKSNPIQQAITFLVLLDPRTFLLLWIGKIWLIFLMFINFSAFLVVLMTSSFPFQEALIDMFHNNRFEFYGWMISFFVPLIIYVVRSMKDSQGNDGFSNDDHISILLDDGNSSFIDLILHTNIDIQKVEETHEVEKEYVSDDEEVIPQGDSLEFEENNIDEEVEENDEAPEKIQEQEEVKDTNEKEDDFELEDFLKEDNENK